MQIRCTSCGKTLQVDDKFAGKKVKCPCSAVLQVPGVAIAASAAPPTRTVASPSAPGAAATKPTAPKPVAKPGPGAFGIDHKEMSSLFDELTADDMLITGKSTDPKKEKKKKDPLAAYGGSSIPTPASGKSSNYASSSGNLNLASQNQRFVTSFLDNLFIGICSYAVGFGVGIALVANGSFTEETVKSATLYVQLFSWVMTLLYFFALEAAMGRTLGKLAAGTRVVAEDGSDASMGKLIGRTLCRFIPFDPVSFLFGKNPVGWHDKISGTRVISIR
jgi:uncharacterized RDD family membrane protein YckC